MLPRRRLSILLIASLLASFPFAGCHRQHEEPGHNGNVVPLGTGITFRREAEAGVQLLDIDLLTAKVQQVVVAAHVQHQPGSVNFVGDAKTVQEWVTETGALGGMNAGFFGDTYDQLGRRKQLVGLTVAAGKTVAPGDFIPSTKRPGERYLRSVIGFHADGSPEITWATSTLRGPLRSYTAPVNPPGKGEVWDVRSAVACGPRLFASGQRRITDRDERLVSAGKLPRAFIAYDREENQPRHLILGRADAMEFADVATFLTDYFARVHNNTPREAMCLDGGPSAQLVYRQEGRVMDVEPTGVLVPSAILLLPQPTNGTGSGR